MTSPSVHVRFTPPPTGMLQVGGAFLPRIEATGTKGAALDLGIAIVRQRVERFVGVEAH